MQNYENSFNESVITDDSYIQQNNQQQLNNNIFCQFNNNATLLCTNQKCIKPAFICEIKHCQCRKQHQMCYKLEVQILLRNIQNKKVFVKSLEACINDGVQQIIGMLSTYREETITKMKKDFEFFSLSQNEKKFLKEIKDGECNNVTGSKIWQMIQQKNEHVKISKMVEQTCKSLRSVFQKSKKPFEQIVKNTKKSIEQLDNKVDKFLMGTEIPKCMMQKGDKLIDELIQLNQSKIMTSLDQFKVTEGFFAPRILKSVNLFYRASQNDFDIKKFHEKCDGIPDTLVIVETQFGKKIGGYTSIKWSSSTGVSVSDESMASFIFSLTEGDKFELKNKTQAVRHYPNYGPIFGSGGDLYICNEPNTNNFSRGNINSSYVNQKYKHNDKESLLKFVGNGEPYNFKVKQWQVWRIEFLQ